MSRSKAERDVIAAAKEWLPMYREAQRAGYATHYIEKDLAQAVDALLTIEDAGPKKIADLDERALDAIAWAMGWRPLFQLGGAKRAKAKATPKMVFDLGHKALSRLKDVGPGTLRQFESVLRANGFDVGNWRAR